MVTDFKTLIPNAVTVSFRLECVRDLQTVLDILFTLTAKGHVIDLRTHLNLGNLSILEPLVEVTLSESALSELVREMNNQELNLHVGLDTMRRLPMEQNRMERVYGKNEFSVFVI